MDITPTTTPTTTTSTKSPEAATETPPTRIQPSKPSSFTNGVLKRHHPNHHHLISTPVIVTYKECLKNHAASLGGHALDGCGEFMPSPSAISTDPTSLKCAVCGCHRNFHRREPDEPPLLSSVPATHVIEYQPHHRHHPPPPPPPPLHGGVRSPNSASPPPISSSYYPSAPHMLLALSAGVSGPPENVAVATQGMISPNTNSRKRFRTKFSQDQKEKMLQFAERVGWKMQKRDEELVQEFCHEIGVDKNVLKVWMHNNKNTFAKRDAANGTRNNILDNTHNIHDNNNNGVQNQDLEHNESVAHVATNGSSSSS